MSEITENYFNYSEGYNLQNYNRNKLVLGVFSRVIPLRYVGQIEALKKEKG